METRRDYTGVVTMQGIDVGDQLYWSWEWDDGDGGFLTPDPSELAQLLGKLDAGVPSQGRAMLANAAAGVLARPKKERRFAQRLGGLLLPERLTTRLREEKERTGGVHVLLLVLPSPSCSRVPWELLRTNPDVDNDERLIELADVATMAQLLPRDGDSDLTHPNWEERRRNPPVHIIDPELGTDSRILNGNQARAWRRRTGRTGIPQLGTQRPTTYQHLSDALHSEPRPSRLFFVGHVVANQDAPEQTAMLLAGVGGDSHNQTAFEMALALETAEQDDGLSADRDWPVPPRVALIACESGTDLAFVEPYGLVTVMLERGAELVTATRWTMFTDHSFGLLESAATPFNDLAIAVDDAHQSDDPVHALNEWQRGRLQQWRQSGAVGDAPLTWAAVTNWLAPDRTIRP